MTKNIPEILHVCFFMYKPGGEGGVQNKETRAAWVREGSAWTQVRCLVEMVIVHTVWLS